MTDNVPRSVVIEHLRKIQASVTFVKQVSARAVLGFLTTKTLEDPDATIEADAIAEGALGLGSNVKNRGNAARAAVSRVKNSLPLYYLIEGDGDPIRLEIESGTHRVKFSWATSEVMLRRRVREAAVIGTAVLSIFAVLDYLHFGLESSGIRASAAALVFGVYLFGKKPLGEAHPFGLAVAGFLAATFSEARIIHVEHLYLTGYSSGFYLIMLAFGVLIPVDWRRSLGVCTSIALTCFGPAWWYTRADQRAECLRLTISILSAVVMIVYSRHSANVLRQGQITVAKSFGRPSKAEAASQRSDR